MMKPVIKWSGSKRSQASKIKSFFPETFGTYYEPFIGGGSMLYAISPSKSICGDICVSLIDLWNEIKEHPEQLASEYEVRWSRLQNEGYTAYYDIRDNFNQHNNPQDLLFLSLLSSSVRPVLRGLFLYRLCNRRLLLDSLQ